MLLGGALKVTDRNLSIERMFIERARANEALVQRQESSTGGLGFGPGSRLED